MTEKTYQPVVGKIWVNKSKTTGEILNLGIKLSAEELQTAMANLDATGQVSLIAFKNRKRVEGKNHPHYNILVARDNGATAPASKTTARTVTKKTSFPEISAEDL